MTSFNSAEASAIFKTGICTLLAISDEGCDHIPITVYLEKTALFRLSASLGAHPFLELRIIAFKEGRLRFQKRSSAVPYDAASPPALLVIAAEIFCNDFGRDKNVPYFYD